MTEPLNPVQIEQKLRALVNAITLAQSDLRQARLEESDTAIALMRAEVTASMDSECPQVKRGEVTVADREAWIDARTVDVRAAANHASTLREIAMDALRARIAESQAVQSLNASVRQAYAMAGHE
jgi:hypothetical protein